MIIQEIKRICVLPWGWQISLKQDPGSTNYKANKIVIGFKYTKNEVFMFIVGKLINSERWCAFRQYLRVYYISKKINIKYLQEILNQQDQGKELSRKKQGIKKIKFPEEKSHTHSMNTNN